MLRLLMVFFLSLGLFADNIENHHLKKELECFEKLEELKKINQPNLNNKDSFVEKYYNKILVKVENNYYKLKAYFENEYKLVINKELSDNINIIDVPNNKFIAHAGGIINDEIYTNSLEALNENYKKGFKLFELDILKTSDDVYVAVHNWTEWKQKTNYEGELPPTINDFKKYKLLNKYTPLDINDINRWFCKHTDTILVTDKVKKPKEFVKKFIDKNRLIMELFSWKEIHNGIEAGVNVMPTWGTLTHLKKDDIIKTLKNYNIKYIAASRRVINENKKLLMKLLKDNIRVYAFHVNYDNGIDEKYVVCNEFKYFYGLYADKWDFSTKLDCKNK